MSDLPDFRPSIVEVHGVGTVYDDGRVYGAVDVWCDQDTGRRRIAINEWSSLFPNRGCTTQALSWMREHFDMTIANGVGLIEDGVGDDSTNYWEHMRSKGLVHVLIDDNCFEIEPGWQGVDEGEPRP